jgi:hypothetical protein
VKLLLTLLLPLTAFCSEPDIAQIPWPKAVTDFPAGQKVTFTSGSFRISRRIPDDPEVQAAGGTGGPIVEFRIRDAGAGWATTFAEQSIGERLLEPYKGKPQFEIWGRGGGGSFSRSLYRYISVAYRRVRTDEFEETPRHHNESTLTTELPSARRENGAKPSRKLWFVEIRIPSP